MKILEIYKATWKLFDAYISIIYKNVFYNINYKTSVSDISRAVRGAVQ